MNIKNYIGNVFYLISIVTLPVVVYYLKNKYTTIDVAGNQFSTMSTIFPAYFILTLIIIWILPRPDIKKEKKKDVQKEDSENI